MNWLHSNLNGKMSFFLGAIALLCILAPTTVPELNDGKPGILNYLGNNLESTFTFKEPPSLEPEMKASGMFPISEKREKDLLIIVSVVFSLVSLVFAFLSEKAKEFTLYYAGGVLASLNALVFFNVFVAIAIVTPAIIVLWFLHRSNKKPNQTHQPIR